jgi:hypothetical protein
MVLMKLLFTVLHASWNANINSLSRSAVVLAGSYVTSWLVNTRLLMSRYRNRTPLELARAQNQTPSLPFYLTS